MKNRQKVTFRPFSTLPPPPPPSEAPIGCPGLSGGPDRPFSLPAAADPAARSKYFRHFFTTRSFAVRRKKWIKYRLLWRYKKRSSWAFSFAHVFDLFVIANLLCVCVLLFFKSRRLFKIKQTRTTNVMLRFHNLLNSEISQNDKIVHFLKKPICLKNLKNEKRRRIHFFEFWNENVSCDLKLWNVIWNYKTWLQIIKCECKIMKCECEIIKCECEIMKCECEIIKCKWQNFKM